MLTKAEVDRIITEPKEIRRDVHWTNVSSSGVPRLRLQTVVNMPTMMDISLQLRGYFRGGNYSFTLLYENYCLVRYDRRPYHTNPDGTEVTEPHKHFWDETYGDKQACPATNVPPDDLDRAFHEFLRECNVTLWGQYSRPLRLL